LQARAVGRFLLGRKVRLAGADDGEAFGQSLLRFNGEEVVETGAGRRVKMGEVIILELAKIKITGLGNDQGVGKGLRRVGKVRSHLRP